jgi:hypothetical protein
MTTPHQICKKGHDGALPGKRQRQEQREEERAQQASKHSNPTNYQQKENKNTTSQDADLFSQHSLVLG